MGAQLWYHEAPWDSEPSAALKALQARVLTERYDLARQLPQELVRARESVSAVEAEGDEYDLLDLYRDKVELLERICSQPIPQAPESQIKILREINADSGEGIGNVLDVTGVSDERDIHTAQRLSEPETARLIGANRPTIAQARGAVGRINEELGRGESVCFPVYGEDESKGPVGWYFVGNTID